MMKHMSVVLGFDMETDVGSWSPYYRGLVEGTPMILDILKKWDIHATKHVSLRNWRWGL